MDAAGWPLDVTGWGDEMRRRMVMAEMTSVSSVGRDTHRTVIGRCRRDEAGMLSVSAEGRSSECE
eukprot:scaffold55719_cov86-Attheya_sp.AAC.1